MKVYPGRSLDARVSGFSLVELIIAMAIIAILATLAVPQFAEYRLRAYNSAALSDLKNVTLTLDAYYIDNRHYPDAIEW